MTDTSKIVATPNKFHYLLNAMEDAGCENDPSAHLYRPKRRAVLEHVSNLERQSDELAEALNELVSIRDTGHFDPYNIDLVIQCDVAWKNARAVLARRDEKEPIK